MSDNMSTGKLSTVGKETPRIDAYEKLTGEATYVSDMKLPGMLYAQVKKSPHARARILRIKTGKAKSLPGVRAVITGAELNYRVGMYMIDKYILAKGEVRHYGEAIAAVAADTLATARKAVELIDVEYEVLPPILHPIDALKKDAPLVHPQLGEYDYMDAVFTPIPGTNICNHTMLRKGDIEKAFKKSEWIIEREYTNPSVQHVPMETHVCIVLWKQSDQVTIWSSAQSPFTLRNLFCKAFKLPHQNVRVIVPYVGGGFGGKAGIHIEPLVACLSRKAGGRPVKFTADREEEFSLLPCRSALIYRIKTGVSNDGRVLGQHMNMYWDSGAYADYAVNVTRASGYSAAGPYDIPNAWVDAYTIYTNKPFGTAYRGFGHVEFFWGLERHMELVAHAIGMDPLTFRKKNALRPGSITLTGEKIHRNTGSILRCLEEAERAIGYGKLTAAEKAREKKSGMKIGKAVVGLHKAPAMPPFTATGVVMRMNEDATVTVNFALTEIGQGTYTAIAQIVSERLRFPIERIKITSETDTDRDPYDWQTVASKGVLLTGNAALVASDDLLRKAYHVAAQVLRAQPIDLNHNAEGVFVKHDPEMSVSFREMATGYAFPDGRSIEGPLIGVGRYIAQGLTHLDKETGQGLPALDWTYGAHGLIVEVNIQTGAYNILKVASVFDVGKVVNPDAVRGQAIGGMIQGLGTAMCEGYIYDQEGHLLNPSFTDNKIPTAKDIPPEIESIAVETPQLDGPFGARGVGEHSMIAVAAVLGNAIQNACGAEIMHMPIRFEDVWRALKKKELIDNWITKSPYGSCRSAPEIKAHYLDNQKH